MAFVGLALLVAAAGATIVIVQDRLDRRRRRPLTDEQVADALAPFGADISIWPARAPRNGSTHEDTAA